MTEPLEGTAGPAAGSDRPSIIAPGHTFGSVTDKIASIVLARRTPIGCG